MIDDRRDIQTLVSFERKCKGLSNATIKAMSQDARECLISELLLLSGRIAVAGELTDFCYDVISHLHIIIDRDVLRES